METTPFGIFWIILGLVSLFWRDGGVLLSLLAFAAIFQASMVLSLSIGDSIEPILPYYWVAILVSLRLVWAALTNRLTPLPSNMRVAMFLLVTFALAVTFVTLTAPWIFKGLPVYDPQQGIDSQYFNLGKLEFRFSMLGQLGYLWLNVIVVWYAAMEGTRKGVANRVVRVLMWTGGLAAVLAFWQYAAWKLGLPYPYNHLNNAAGWSPGYMQFLSGIKRINGSFTEPSSMAAYMVGLFAFAVSLWLRGRSRGAGVLAALTLISLVISTSTTAYLGLLGLALLGLFVAASHQRQLSRRVITAVLIAAIAAVALWPVVAANKTIQQVLDSTVISKRASPSFLHRTAADLWSFELLVETGGIGVGLGGNRPSSFIASVASNTGIVGLALLALFVLALWRASWLRAKNDLHLSMLVSAATWGLAGNLIAKQLSQPDLSQPTVWVWIAVLAMLATSPREGVARS